MIAFYVVRKLLAKNLVLFHFSCAFCGFEDDVYQKWKECSLLLTSTSLVPRPVQKIGEKGLVSTILCSAQNILGIPANTVLPLCAVTSGMCILLYI